MKHRTTIPIMRAPDMFDEHRVQVFNRKTGDWIMTVVTGYEVPEECDAVEPVTLPGVNKKQLTLF